MAHQSMQMPNAANFGFDYYYACWLAVLAYLPGAPAWGPCLMACWAAAGVPATAGGSCPSAERSAWRMALTAAASFCALCWPCSWLRRLSPAVLLHAHAAAQGAARRQRPPEQRREDQGSVERRAAHWFRCIVCRWVPPFGCFHIFFPALPLSRPNRRVAQTGRYGGAPRRPPRRRRERWQVGSWPPWHSIDPDRASASRQRLCTRSGAAEQAFNSVSAASRAMEVEVEDLYGDFASPVKAVSSGGA